MGISGSPVMAITGTGFVATGVLITSPALDHVSDLRRSIGQVSRLRFTLAHENAHLLFLDRHGSNRTGSTAFMEAFQLLSSVTRGAPDGWWLSGAQADAAPARPPLLPPDQPTGHGFGGLRGPFILLTFRKDVLSPDNRAAFLRLIDGVLAANDGLAGVGTGQ